MEKNGKKAIVYNTKKRKNEGDKKKTDWLRKRERKNIKVEEIQQQKGRIWYSPS